MGSCPEFTTRIDSRNGVARIVLSGDLDLATVPSLEDQLAEVERDGITAIMLDLRELDFLDSTALHAFLVARSRAEANGHQLILVGVGTPSRRLFELTGTEFLLDDRHAAGVIDRFNQAASSLVTRTPERMVDSDA